ncbi:MAG: peptidylprolyl isomerase [Bacteroidota bacterium]
MFKIIKFNFLFAFIVLAAISKAQPGSGETIDGIVGVFADKIILHSEIEFEYQQFRKEYPERVTDTLRCDILRQKLTEKLLATKAEVDSLPLSEERIEGELEQRIQYFARQFGGDRGLEEFYGKSISEIKANYREKIKTSLLVQEMQQKILKDIKISPTDIKTFFNSLEKDSLPYYSAEVEVAQIIIEPKVSKEAKDIALQKATELRDRLLNGDNFRTIAKIYSDDKGSAVQGGELGFFGRGMMVPEFEAAAFKTPQDSISRIVETKFGYHIIQPIKRRGEEVNARHVLIRPQIYRADIDLAKQRIDSVINLIKIDTITFADAAKKFSTDKRSGARGGYLTDGSAGNTKIPVDELPKDIFLNIQGLKPGDMTEPELTTIQSQTGEPIKVWRVLYLKSESLPHVANLKDDYQKMQTAAEEDKKNKTLARWIDKNRKQFYVHIADEYKTCPSLEAWQSKTTQ